MSVSPLWRVGIGYVCCMLLNRGDFAKPQYYGVVSRCEPSETMQLASCSGSHLIILDSLYLVIATSRKFRALFNCLTFVHLFIIIVLRSRATSAVTAGLQESGFQVWDRSRGSGRRGHTHSAVGQHAICQAADSPPTNSNVLT